MNTLKQEIRRLEQLFTSSKRQDGTVFWHCKDTVNDSDRDLVRDFHETDILPDDFRFETIVNLLDKLNEYDFDSVDYIRDNGIDHEIIDILVNFETSKLTAWLASHNSRIEWCNEAVNQGLIDGSDIIKTIQCGQYLEIQMIMNNILSHLETLENNTELEIGE